MDPRNDSQGREPAFDAIIPAPVRYCDELRANAKLLYGEIRALSGPYGYCWATNSYFAELYGMNERSIARLIAQLEKLKFISIAITRDDLGHVNGRKIYIGCGFPQAENDTLSHMTKKSAYMTKKSGLTDQKVIQDINKNNINKKGDARAPAREKEPEDAAARAFLREWAMSYFPEDNAELISDLMDFCNTRCARKKPMDEVTKAERCTKRLLKLSEGNLEVIQAILDRSIRNGWTDVFELPEDELTAILGKNASSAGGYEKCL